MQRSKVLWSVGGGFFAVNGPFITTNSISLSLQFFHHNSQWSTLKPITLTAYSHVTTKPIYYFCFPGGAPPKPTA